MFGIDADKINTAAQAITALAQQIQSGVTVDITHTTLTIGETLVAIDECHLTLTFGPKGK